MASISGSRSAGKMLRPRRTPAARPTPYDRPAPSHNQSPNWVSRFVLSPTRFIASGAGKLISSVLDLESSPTSSSSSASDADSASDIDSTAREEARTFDDENGKTFQGDDALNKGPHPLAGNSKSKHVIEQLLMQETFSREECERLIKIIKSRVVDSPANDGGDKRPRDMPSRNLGSDTASPDLCSAAVMEAKKWLQEKKSGLDSNSELDYGSHGLNLVASPQAPKDEGSPVDVAKSYMQTRPPWASPSIGNIKPPTPAGVQLFKEETLHLFSGNSTLSSKLKRDSPATGSWSIQEEIRRVRSRETEEMLRTLPSPRIDWSAFSMEDKNNANSSAIENIEASLGEKVHNFTKLADASPNLVRGLHAQGFPDLESKLAGLQPESVRSDPADIDPEQNQGFEAVQQTKGSRDSREITTSGQKDGSLDDMHRDDGLVKVNGINDTNEANHQIDSMEEIREESNSEFKENVVAEDALVNGFPSSGTNFNAGQVIEQNTEKFHDEPSKVGSGQERTAKGVIEQETCKLSTESMEVADVIVNDTIAFKENDDVATGSQNSSSVQYEAQPDYSQPGSEPDLTATPTSIAKQKGKRITTRYNRRGRSRGTK